jgi:general nucleoside transport system permease protein
LLIGAVIIGMIGVNPLEAYQAMFEGALGSTSSIMDTLERSTPYIIGGLAFAFASKAGLFNIGIEGQMYIGALMAAIVGFSLHGLPAIVHIPLCIAAGMIGGMAWTVVPGLLKIKIGVHEVISTVMLNYVAFAVTGYLTVHWFLEPGAVAQTPEISSSAVLAFLSPPSKLNTGIIIAMICAVLMYVFLYHTPRGYSLRVNGLNTIAARYAGINSTKILLLSMLVSGALAGLMGAERTLGVYHRFMQSFSSGYGYTVIAVALLGRNHPLGVIPAAILFGMLENGASTMSLMVDVPREFGPILQALIIVVIASAQFFGRLSLRRKGGQQHG